MIELERHDVAAPVRKEAGEPKELHETRLGAAATVLDIHAYVDDFNSAVLDAYRRGVADIELPSETGVARSVVPPGTAAARDFSGLAPQIPEFVLDACVGCMACVNACPDSAIIGTAQPATVLETTIAGFSAVQPEPELATETARSHFATTTEVRDGARQAWARAGRVRDLRQPGPLQGLRGVCRGLSRPRLSRAANGRQAAAGAEWREHARALRPRHALPALTPAHARALPEREGPRRPHARRACLRLRGRRGLVLGLRRGHRAADARRCDAPAARRRIDGRRRGDRLQYRLRQHVPVQPVSHPVDELALRECPGRRTGHPFALGPGWSHRTAAVGRRRRRRDVRHRLPGTLTDGRLGRRHQGSRARHAGLFEHRRPGFDGLLRRAGHEAVGVPQGRFAGHFPPNAAPSPEILATQADRLANWHTLQELAGLV